MTSSAFTAAVAATLAGWEHAEVCSLDHLLLGLSEEVGIRRSVEYWTQDRKGWTHHASGIKLRHCLADLDDLCKTYGVIEVFASRPAPDSPVLSIWYRHLKNPQTHYEQVTAAGQGQDLAELQGVPA